VIEYASISIPFALWYIILEIPHILINIEIIIVQLLFLKKNINEEMVMAIDALRTIIYGVKTFPPGNVKFS
jgi:hypothetical protein